MNLAALLSLALAPRPATGGSPPAPTADAQLVLNSAAKTGFTVLMGWY